MSLTLRWFRPDGTDSLYSVRGSIDHRGNASARSLYFTHSFNGVEVESCTIDAGSVYIMNDAGKTIAAYHFP